MDTQQRVIDSNNVFSNYFIDSKALYMYYFNKVPSISVVSQIDGERAFDAVMERYGNLVKEVHSYRCYKKRKEKTEFSDTMVVLVVAVVMVVIVIVVILYCEMLRG